MNQGNLPYYNLLTKTEKEEIQEKLLKFKKIFENLENPTLSEKEEYLEAYEQLQESFVELEDAIPTRLGLQENSTEYNRIYTGLANSFEIMMQEEISPNDKTLIRECVNTYQHEIVAFEAERTENIFKIYDLLTEEEQEDLRGKIIRLKESFDSIDSSSDISEKQEYVKAYNEVFETCYKIEHRLVEQENIMLIDTANGIEGFVYMAVNPEKVTDNASEVTQTFRECKNAVRDYSTEIDSRVLTHYDEAIQLLTKEEQEDFKEKASRLKEAFSSIDSDSSLLEKKEYINAYNELFETCRELEHKVVERSGYPTDSIEASRTLSNAMDGIEGVAYMIVNPNEEIHRGKEVSKKLANCREELGVYKYLTKEEQEDLEGKMAKLRTAFDSIDRDSSLLEKKEYIAAYNEVFETCKKLEKEIPQRLGLSQDSAEYNHMYAQAAHTLEGMVYDETKDSKELQGKLHEFEKDVIDSYLQL